MSMPQSPRPVDPKPDDLAGTPACQEENNPTIRVRGLKDGNTVSPQSTSATPTADDLAGIPVTAEGDEDLTIRPRRSRP